MLQNSLSDKSQDPEAFLTAVAYKQIIENTLQESKEILIEDKVIQFQNHFCVAARSIILVLLNHRFYMYCWYVPGVL